MIRTLILTEKEGWHFQQLKTSLEKRKHKVFSGCLSNISLSLSNNKAELFINDAPIPEIDNVIVRFVPGGTLEEITYYLNILKIFEGMGVRVINTAQKIESTVDKLYTSYILSKNNIKTPDTFIFRDFEKAKKFLDTQLPKEGIVYKPLFGSQGDNVKLIKNPYELKEIENLSNIFYFQQYLDNSINHDYRILVIRKDETYKYFYMTRYGDSFINNVSKGGSCKKESIDKSIIDLALKASKLLNISFCGVDIMSFKNNNYIIEINSIPAWRGLQNVESEIISDHFVNLLMT